AIILGGGGPGQEEAGGAQTEHGELSHEHLPQALTFQTWRGFLGILVGCIDRRERSHDLGERHPRALGLARDVGRDLALDPESDLDGTEAVLARDDGSVLAAAGLDEAR